MPLYVFTCKSCGKESEQLLKVDESPECCSACGGEQVKEITSATARFIGPDWGGNERTPDGKFTVRLQRGKDTDA
jgi:putative FmdB family regulatory protein